MSFLNYPNMPTYLYGMSNQKRNRDMGIPGHPTEFAPTTKDESNVSLTYDDTSVRESLHMSESARLCKLITASSTADWERRAHVRSLVELNVEYGALSETDLDNRLEAANEWGGDLDELIGDGVNTDYVANNYVEVIKTHLDKHPEDAPYMSDIAALWLIEDEDERQTKRGGRESDRHFAPPSPASFEGAYEEGDPKLYALREWSKGN